MAEDIVELVRRSYDAFARGDTEALLSGATEDFVTYRDEPDGATFHGKQGLLEAITSWTEDFEEFAFEVEELIPLNDRQVLARIHQSAVGKHSGVAIEATFWFLHTVEGDRLSRLDMFAHRDRAYEAAGPETD
jgi:ketosteroid isomerase-like protein